MPGKQLIPPHSPQYRHCQGRAGFRISESSYKTCSAFASASNHQWQEFISPGAQPQGEKHCNSEGFTVIQGNTVITTSYGRWKSTVGTILNGRRNTNKIKQKRTGWQPLLGTGRVTAEGICRKCFSLARFPRVTKELGFIALRRRLGAMLASPRRAEGEHTSPSPKPLSSTTEPVLLF